MRRLLAIVRLVLKKTTLFPIRFCICALTACALAVPAFAQDAPQEGGNGKGADSTALPTLIVEAPKTRPKPKPKRQTAVRAATKPARQTRTDSRAKDTANESASSSAGAGGGDFGQASDLARWSSNSPDGGPAFVRRYQLPNALASATRAQIAAKVNIVDPEDAVKYLPSLFVRKRNNGDTQAVLATRTWGVNSSARTLVYADDLLLTALIANDNTMGAPRWGMVAPDEIERVDFLYGPFSAAYPGNSMGGVLQITTRMPEKAEASIKQTEAAQTFDLWGTNRTYWTHSTEAFVGDRAGALSWSASGRFMQNQTQPLTYATTSSPYPWAGMVSASNKIGGAANVLGAMGQLDQQQATGRFKLAYDVTPAIRATYQVGLWSNDSHTQPQNYIGTFGEAAASSRRYLGAGVLQSFGGGYYRIQERTLANAGAVKSNSGGVFDFSVSVSNFSYLTSDQISSYSAVPTNGAARDGYTRNGKISRMDGTYWNLFDANGIWRPGDFYGVHEASFGFHADDYHLNNPVWLTSNWARGSDAVVAPLSNAQGTTRTQALWMQDAWRFHPAFKLTVGGRWENWAARDGANQATAGLNAYGTGWTQTLANIGASQTIRQPNRHLARFSPKGSLEWKPSEEWTIVGSIGLANRFPTVRELYNLTAVANASGLLANPNPNVRPEAALSSEARVERALGQDGTARVSLFNEEVRDAIVSQNIYVSASSPNVAGVSNVDKIRNRGVEIAFRKNHFLFEGLEIEGSATYVDSRVLLNRAWAGGTAANNDLWNVSTVGKNVNYVPKWRWTLTGTYRPDDFWSFSLAARWQDRMWSTLSNNDSAHGVYGAFDRFFVVDMKVRYKWSERASFDFGVDNIGNYKYFLFHPFPQRTFVFSGKYQFGDARSGASGVFKPVSGDNDVLGRIASAWERL